MEYAKINTQEAVSTTQRLAIIDGKARMMSNMTHDKMAELDYYPVIQPTNPNGWELSEVQWEGTTASRTPIEPEEVELTIEEVIASKITEIQAYDKSSEVNQFTVGGVSAWFGRSDREALYSRIERERRAGNESISVYIEGVGNVPFTLDDAFATLDILATYADAVFDVTNSSISAVTALTSVDYVNAYDYKSSYPTIIEL